MESLTSPLSIETCALTKSYGAVKALDNVSLSVAQGELFGLIGPDGAGKTTLFRLLTTLLVPDSGRATVEGCDTVRDYRAIRNKVGYMPGRFSLYPDLTVAENLAFFAALFGVDPADNYALIAPMYRQLEPFRKRRAGKLSGGMKQKLALCCALVHRPSLLLLDEPTTGIDAVARGELWDMLADLRRQGLTVLVSTPYMDEAVRCDRVALIHKGRLLGTDTPRAVVDKFDEPLYALSGGGMLELQTAARRCPLVTACYPCGAVHHLVAARNHSAEALERYFRDAGFAHVTLRPVKADIEDVFIKCMGHEG